MLTTEGYWVSDFIFKLLPLIIFRLSYLSNLILSITSLTNYLLTVRNLKHDGPTWFFRWLTYLDDVYAIFDIKKCKIHNFMSLSNNRLSFIIIMFEIENKEQLSFPAVLDIGNFIKSLMYSVRILILTYIPNKN